MFCLNVERNDIKQLNLAMFSFWPNLAFLQIDFNSVETLEDMSAMTHGRERVLKVGFNSSPPWTKWMPCLADDIFKCIFLNESDKIPFKFSLKLVSGGPIDSKLALVQVLAWHWAGDKPLPEPMMTQFTDAHMRH